VHFVNVTSQCSPNSRHDKSSPPLACQALAGLAHQRLLTAASIITLLTSARQVRAGDRRTNKRTNKEKNIAIALSVHSMGGA